MTPIYSAQSRYPNGMLIPLEVRRVRSVCCDRPMFAESRLCPECRADQRPYIGGILPRSVTTTP